MKSEKDYYQILGIQRNASMDEIRKAYRLYATKFHPDKHDGDVFFEERFKELSEAYDILSDDEKRTRYDIKKFGRSTLVRKTEFEKEVQQATTKRKAFRFDILHLDIYLTLFYFINLAVWVVIKRLNEGASTEGHIWSLFLCGSSTLIMWIFITKWLDLRNHHTSVQRSFPVGYLLLALIIGSVPLITNWVP